MEAAAVSDDITIIGTAELTMSSTPSAGVFLTAYEATTGNIGQSGCLTITEGHVQMLSPASSVPSKQSGHDAVARVQTRRQIRHSHAHFHRRSISGAGDVHQSKFRLDHDIVPSPLRVRTSLSISGDGSVDEPWVNLVDCIEIQLVLLQSPRDIILNKNVTFCGQLV